jgi:hypothetical protein
MSDRTCSSCRHFRPGHPLGTCARIGGPLGALRLDLTHWLCHRDADHPCHEPRDVEPASKERS